MLLLQPEPLFQKLEQKFMDELKAKFAGQSTAAASPSKAAASDGVTSQGAPPVASQAEIDKLAQQVTAQVRHSGYVRHSPEP